MQEAGDETVVSVRTYRGTRGALAYCSSKQASGVNSGEKEVVVVLLSEWTELKQLVSEITEQFELLKAGYN